ncbi:MAG: ADP-glyceromanno-heptose 6-epimerase [Gammaproteobacteria bacterium]|nr:ADP-glyceromanno-heptose 6-epimerase [Gammaproteobacteria bacterium]
MIIVTGAAGFIGGNLLRGLNAAGRTDLVAVDDLTDGSKFSNLVECDLLDYLDKDEFMASLPQRLAGVEAVLHQGACSDTRVQDGRFMLENNYAWSRRLLDACQDAGVPLIYASSAAVYGNSRRFIEAPQYERPVNVYGYSKLLFDHYVRRVAAPARAPIVGLRYFNVYGPGERHKGAMASMIFRLHEQLLEDGVMKLFKGSGGYEDGEQRRDFVYIDDVTEVNLWAMHQPQVRGIFNVGCGRSRSFNDVTRLLADWHGKGRVEYMDFPPDLLAAYQSFTQADISALREAGYRKSFTGLEQGIRKYLQELETRKVGALDSGSSPE